MESDWGAVFVIFVISVYRLVFVDISLGGTHRVL